MATSVTTRQPVRHSVNAVRTAQADVLRDVPREPSDVSREPTAIEAEIGRVRGARQVVERLSAAVGDIADRVFGAMPTVGESEKDPALKRQSEPTPTYHQLHDEITQLHEVLDLLSLHIGRIANV